MEEIKKGFFEKIGNDKKIIQHQSKLNVKVTHQPYTDFDSDTLKQNEAPMDEPTYSGFGILELIKMLMYKAHYDKLHHYFGEKSIQCPYVDNDDFV